MLKLGIDVTWLPHDSRGMGRYVRSILSQLLRESDIAVTFISRQPDMTDLSGALGQAYPVLGWRNRGLEALDVCWYPWNRIDVPAPTRRAVTIHDVAAVDCPLTGALAFLDNRKAYRMLQQAVKRADRVMTVSNFSRDRLQTLFKPGAMSVVTEGSSLGADVAPVSNVQQPFVLYVGAVDDRKNVAGLLLGWSRLVADGRARDRVLVLRAGPPLPCGPQVVWLPSVSDRELSWLYRNCAAFVMPSLYEGFGLPLLEAMAAGAPVASSRETSLPEVGGEVPEYFDPRQPDDIARALDVVLNQERAAERMRLAGPARAKLFTWERATRQVLECLYATAEWA